MKTFRFLRNGAMMMLAAAAFTACSDDDDTQLRVDFDDAQGITYNEQGYWDKVYDTNETSFSIDGVIFSHQASATEWGGYTYYSWYGFCPSKSTDNTDYSDGDWTSNQWGAITGGGVAGNGDAYLLGFWNSSEDTNTRPVPPACSISYGGGAFDPEEVYVTNSAWGYYAMKNGSAFNKQLDMLLEKEYNIYSKFRTLDLSDKLNLGSSNQKISFIDDINKALESDLTHEQAILVVAISKHETGNWTSELYKKNNRWIENDAYVPTKGDIIFYDWNADGFRDHVGIIENIIGSVFTFNAKNYK